MTSNGSDKKPEDIESITLKKVIDYRGLIERCTRTFVGRNWLRKEIDKFLLQKQPRCFLILGEPGSGKTAFLADLINRRYYPHHFIASAHYFIGQDTQVYMVSNLEWYDPVRFAESIGYQLLRDYGGWVMDWESWGISVNAKVKSSEGFLVGAHVKEFNATPRIDGNPILSVEAEFEKFSEHSRFIGVYIDEYKTNVERVVDQLVKTPLSRIAEKWPEINFVVAVDGLDEAKTYSYSDRTICKILSAIGLPSSIRLLLTSRPGDHIDADLLGQSQVFWLSDDKKGERDPRINEDAREYVKRLAEEDDIRIMLERYELSKRDFIDRVADAAEGNFQYLHVYAQELREGNQALLKLESLPVGLGGIYKNFLKKIKNSTDKSFYTNAYKPVLGALAVAKEPLTQKQISNFSETNRRSVATVVTDIKQFLDMAGEGSEKSLYKIYHRTFSEYIVSEDNEDYVGAEESHNIIVDYYMKKSRFWYDNYATKYLATHMIAAKAWDELEELVKDIKYLEQKKEQQYLLQDDIINLILNQEIPTTRLVDILEQILETIIKNLEDTKEKADWLDIFSYWLNEFGKNADQERWVELKKIANKFDYACGTLSRDLAIHFKNTGENDWALRFAELSTWVYQRANDLPKCVEACEFAEKLCLDKRMEKAYRIVGRPEFLRMRARALNKLRKTETKDSQKERYESETIKAYQELNDAIKFDYDAELELKVDEWQQLEEDKGVVLTRDFSNKKPVEAQVVSNAHDCISAFYIIKTFMKHGIGIRWIHSMKFKSKDLAPPNIKYTILIGGPKSPGISEVAQKFFKADKKGFLELYSAEGMVAKILKIHEDKTFCYMVGGPSKINTLKAAYDFARDPEILSLISK